MDTSLVAERATLIKSSYLLTYFLGCREKKRKEIGLKVFGKHFKRLSRASII